MIKEGDILPDATFVVPTPDGPAPRKSDQIFANRKVVLIGVPGAFTPTCSMNHLPGYIENAEALKAKGVDEIAVTGVNDVFVMEAWAKSTGGEGKVTYLADGSAAFAQAIGAELDLTERGLGIRSKRYSMIVDDGVVKKLIVEPNPGQADETKVDNILSAL
jgi:peroxiredoxin